MCKSMGLILRYFASPSPRGLDHSHQRMPAGVHMDVLNCDLLLALSAMSIERIEQTGVSPGQFVGLGQVFSMTLERLLAEHGAPVTLHRCVVRCEQLSSDHSFKLVFWSNPDQRRDGRGVMFASCLFVRLLNPQRVNCLIGEKEIPTVGLRSTDGFEFPFLVVGIIGNYYRAALSLANLCLLDHRHPSARNYRNPVTFADPPTTQSYEDTKVTGLSG